MIKVSPVDEQMVSNKPELALAVEAFITRNIQSAPKADKAWFAYETDGETFRILGFACCNIGTRIADVPVYHIIEGTTRQEKWAAMKAHEALFARITGYIADVVGSGTEAMFYIAPESQAHWEEFAKRVNGRQAHRFITGVD